MYACSPFPFSLAFLPSFVSSGEIILAIFPDGTGPALLSCMIAGIPFKDVHALEFVPGEVRVDITPESVRALFEKRKDDPEYLAILEDGNEKLASLRRQTSIIGLKEQMAERERLEIDAAFDAKKLADATRERERQVKAAEEKQTQLLAQQEAREVQLRAQKEAREEKERRQQEQKERQRNERAAAVAASDTRSSGAHHQRQTEVVSSSTKSSSSSPDFGISSMIATVTLGALGLGVATLGTMAGGDDDDDDGDGSVPVVGTAQKDKHNEKVATTTATLDTNDDDDNKKDVDTKSKSPKTTTTMKEVMTSPPVAPSTTTAPPTTTTETKLSLYANTMPSTRSPGSGRQKVSQNSATNINNNTTTTASSSVNDDDDDDDESLVDSDAMVQEDYLGQSVAAEHAMKDALQETSYNPNLQQQQRPQQTNGYLDDDDDDAAWLKVLGEIRDEPDDEDEDEFGDVDGDLMRVNGDGRKQAGRSSDL
jgi:hypothetical protein